MKIYVTSNQQFGRPGAIKAYGRPFADVEEMNQYMISQWNSVVTPEDTVFVIGNFVWDPETAERVARQLNGKIFVIPGEWDRAIKDITTDDDFTDQFKVTYMAIGIKEVRALNSVLTYWPMVEWPKKNKGWISYFGYPNKKYPSDHKKNIVNVACDYWDFKPVDIVKVNTLYKDPDLFE